MAKSTKQAARKERRFEATSTTSVPLVATLGGIGALALGAGVYVQFLRTEAPEGPFAYAQWVLAAGAFLLGVAIWFGTTSQPALRVGANGVTVDRSSATRIPWHGISELTFDSAKSELVVAGKDESDVPATIRVHTGAHAFAAAHLLKEAKARVPSVVSVPESMALPEAKDDQGTANELEPLQVAGRRCAESGDLISFEKDAVVCARCERVFHKAHRPKTCGCGATSGFYEVDTAG